MRRRTTAAAAVLVSLFAVGCSGGGSSPSRIDTTSTPSRSASGAPSASASQTGAPCPKPASTYTAPPAQLPACHVALTTDPPPWAPPAVVNDGAQSADYVAAAGLPYGEEVLTVHYHAHLDVTINGEKVTVPPYLGFVAEGSKALGLAPLHTHDDSGIIHIENSDPADFLLGQVFIEWGVKFSDRCLGSYCTGNGKELVVFLNGKPYDGDPTRLVFASHQEISVEYGDAGSLPTPPSSYDFPAGD